MTTINLYVENQHIHPEKSGGKAMSEETVPYHACGGKTTPGGSPDESPGSSSVCQWGLEECVAALAFLDEANRLIHDSAAGGDGHLDRDVAWGCSRVSTAILDRMRDIVWPCERRGRR